jgi:hypothetical protein
MPNDVPLTVSGPPNYTCSPQNLSFPDNTKVVVTPPTQGCTICFSQKVDGKTQYDIAGGTTKKIEFKGFNANDVINFCTWAYQTPCDPTASRTTDDPGHTITIDTSTR